MTRLGQAQNEKERSAIFDEMLSNEEGRNVFKKIEETKKRKEKEKVNCLKDASKGEFYSLNSTIFKGKRSRNNHISCTIEFLKI